jgi:very-short-patch-repair endonuclease
MGRSERLKQSNFCLPYDRELVDRAKEMRRNPTAAEQRLWEGCLSKFPYRVLRQRPINYFIVDFYCAALRLVIEVDGEIHNNEQAREYDAQRSKILEGHCLRVFRVTDAEVLEDFDRVRERIWEFVNSESQNKLKVPLLKGDLGGSP